MNDAQLANVFLPVFLGSTWKATVLLALGCVAGWMLRRSSAAVRHRVWTWTLCGVIAVPAASWLLPGWQLPRFPEGPAIPEPARAVQTRAPAAPRQSDASQSPRLTSAAGPVGISQVAPAPLAVREPVVAAQPAARGGEVPAVRVAQGRPWPRFVTAGAGLVLWCVGFLVVVMPTLAGLAANEVFRRRARPLRAPDWLTLMEGVCRQLSVRRRVELRQGGGALVPLTWGVLRPVILLPESATSWSEAMRRRVLLHELAHVKRFDAGIQLVGRLAVALYWFHPFAWFAFHRLRLECELASDDCVVRAGERATDYARQLLDFVSSMRAPRLAAAVAMARRSTLEERMVALFDDTRSHLPLDRRTGQQLFAGSLVLVFGLATLHTQGPAAPAQEPAGKAAHPAAAPAGATGRITGRVVVDGDGSAAAGAEVVLLFPPPAGQEYYTVKYPLRHAAADAKGEFSFDGLAPGRYRVWAKRGPLTSRRRRADGQVVVLSAAGEAPGPVELRLAAGVTLKVRVTDKGGDPIPGATVHLLWSDFAADPTTDRDGRATLQALRAEQSVVEVWAEGFARERQTINLETGSDTDIPFRLGPGGHLEGVVRDPSGKPLAGVGLSTHLWGKYQQIAYVETDDRGHYRLAFLPRDTDLEISVTRTGLERKDVPARVAAGTARLDLVLKPRPDGGSVTGVVLDHRGRPIAGAELFNMGNSSGDVRETKTGPDGRFRLDNLFASNAHGKEVVVRARGSAPKRVKVNTGPADRVAETTITLDAGHRLRGRVVDEKGRPLEGVRVYFAHGNQPFGDGGQGDTDKDGRFAFDSLPPNCPFDFVKSGYSGIDDRQLTLDTDEVMTVTMVPAGLIAGKVIDASTGKPVRVFNVRITFSPQAQPGDPRGGLWSELVDPGQNYQSDEGRFQLGNLKSGMPLQVTVLADGYEKAVHERVVVTVPGALRVEEYRLEPVDVASVRTYRGRMFDSQGRPIVGAQLRLVVAHDRDPGARDAFPFNWEMIRSGQLAGQSNVVRFLEVETDGNGEFAFPRVPRKGEAELVWWGRGVVPGRSDHLERLNDEGADSLRIVTPAPARIVGTWDRRAFPGAVRVQVSNPPGLGILENEQDLKPDQPDFAFGDLPPGTYQVSLYGPNERVGNDGLFTSPMLATQRVVVEPGKTGRVEFKK